LQTRGRGRSSKHFVAKTEEGLSVDAVRTFLEDQFCVTYFKDNRQPRNKPSVYTNQHALVCWIRYFGKTSSEKIKTL